MLDKELLDIMKEMAAKSRLGGDHEHEFAAVMRTFLEDIESASLDGIEKRGLMRLRTRADPNWTQEEIDEAKKERAEQLEYLKRKDRGFVKFMAEVKDKFGTFDAIWEEK